MLMLLILNPLNSLLTHPPRDFASLLDPAAVLQTMNVQTSDEALLAVLNAPAEPAPAGEPASTELYVKKLMAIRLLEQNKSAKALPALEATAKDPDVTLRDAALEAIAAINGKPGTRPNGAALLKELARSVPPDAGFVVTLDLERDSRSSTARALVENALKEFEARNPNSPPAVRQSAGVLVPMAEQALVQALAATGNLRVDAALLILPPDMGAQPNENYIRCAVKGLYDPARVAALLEHTGDFEKREAAGHAVYVQKQGEMEICLLDPNTFVLVILNKSDKAGIMERFLGGLAAAEKRAPPKPVAEAFDMVTERQARLAVAGAFSPAQKKSFAATLMQNMKTTDLQLGPVEQIAFSGSQMLLDLIQAEAYAASLDTQGKLALHIVCPDATAATALKDSSEKLQTTIFDMVSKQTGGASPPFDAFLRDVTQAGSLWKTETADATVTLKVDNLLTPLMAIWLIQMGAMAPLPPAMPPAAPAEPK
jgi:hypothetical protein